MKKDLNGYDYLWYIVFNGSLYKRVFCYVLIYITTTFFWALFYTLADYDLLFKNRDINNFNVFAPAFILIVLIELFVRYLKNKGKKDD